MRGIIHDTFLEMFDRKSIYIYLAITVITILLVLASNSISLNGGMPAGNDIELGDVNETLGNPVMHAFAAFVSFLVFMTILATAGIFPNMLVKGRSDYYISKPISRLSLYLYKLFSVMIVYGVIIIVSSAICYFVFFLVYGIFDTSIFYMLLLNLLSLFIWLSITTFAGIVFGSTGTTLMFAFGVWAIQFLLSFHTFLKELVSSKAIVKIVETLYYIFPKTGDLSDLTTKIVIGQPVESYLPLWSSLIFAVALVAFTAYIFQKKNY